MVLVMVWGFLLFFSEQTAVADAHLLDPAGEDELSVDAFLQ